MLWYVVPAESVRYAVTVEGPARAAGSGLNGTSLSWELRGHLTRFCSVIKYGVPRILLYQSISFTTFLKISKASLISIRLSGCGLLLTNGAQSPRESSVALAV